MTKASQINNKKEVTVHFSLIRCTFKINTTNLWRLSFRDKLLILLKDFHSIFFPGQSVMIFTNAFDILLYYLTISKHYIPT